MKKIIYEHLHKSIYSRLMIGLLSARIAYRLLDSVQAYRSWPFYGELLLYAAGMALGFYWLNAIHKKTIRPLGSDQNKSIK